MRDAGVQAGWAIVVQGEKIAAIGPEEDARRKYPAAREIDCTYNVITPGLVDSHTHAVFGRARYAEQEMRAAGVSYMEIARSGGGIHSSVADLRTRSEDELFALTLSRIEKLASYGSTTIEIKSGYGLSLEDELKSLRVIARVAHATPVRIVATWLGAHEIPLDYRSRPRGRAEYVKLLVEEILPIVHKERLAQFADVFCEPGVFTVEETRSILDASARAGLGIKLHADELEPAGGAELAAELKAISADHLAAISKNGIAALATTGTVATLLPGTMLFLGRDRQAPARAIIDAGVPVALATDFNPGTSPTVNFPLIMTLGVSQLRMSVAESFVAATVNGAAALDLAETTGQLAPGYSADLAIFEAEDIREIPYWYGDRRCKATWARGKPCHALERANKLQFTASRGDAT
ncbi:MAG TPA: imidazolonepropionase [Gemmatimonadaceae bacterium]|jgi:imidazolonepropionase|nr:imidazolonepropionase [Gemmatimonadaceae bacterium]